MNTPCLVCADERDIEVMEPVFWLNRNQWYHTHCEPNAVKGTFERIGAMFTWHPPTTLEW